jgi:PII-like signaling protein
VLRGIAGFGAASRIHTSNILRLSLDLPIIVEIVDTPERIEAFLPLVDTAVKEGLVTTEKVNIRLYRTARGKA